MEHIESHYGVVSSTNRYNRAKLRLTEENTKPSTSPYRSHQLRRPQNLRPELRLMPATCRPAAPACATPTFRRVQFELRLRRSLLIACAALLKCSASWTAP
ncbi:MAG: hypothetical protein ACLSHC_15040 [Bilophila wadsworthia]